MYKQEIYKLVNDPQQKEFYATNQTTYASTVAVYKNGFRKANIVVDIALTPTQCYT